MMQQRVVIIGGGPAGRVIVHALHKSGSNHAVTLIKDEPINVNRCAVPYGIPTKKPAERFDIPNALVTDFGADLVVDTAAEIDADGGVVRTRGGRSFAYDHLVLATGSRAIVPPIPGVESEGVTAVRDRDDLARLRGWASERQRAIVVGGGYIGVEVAVELRRLGLGVTLVEMLPNILSVTLEPEFIEPIASDLREHGIDVRTGSGVESFIARDGALQGVMLSDGSRIEADFAALAVGVAPNTELAAAAGLEVDRLGIVVDDRLRATHDDIYASGDCARKISYVSGRPTRGEFGTNAVFMSKVVAANILGKERTFPGVINANCSTSFSYAFGSAGLTEPQAAADGLDVVSGRSEVLNAYPMMDRAAPIRAKLTFERESRRLVGGVVMRRDHATAAAVDLISMAIQMGATADDLLLHQYATHPELAAKPSDDMLVFAAQDAIDRLRSSKPAGAS
jgi:NADH oxidase (H2O2-forming)